jgi:hypothetical protein
MMIFRHHLCGKLAKSDDKKIVYDYYFGNGSKGECM